MKVKEEENHSTAASFQSAAVTRLTSRLVCLFICLPAARGTRGPSSSRAAASSSPPHTSSGGPLRCHFAVGGGVEERDQDKQETITAASNEGKHECDRNTEAGEAGRGKYC